MTGLTELVEQAPAISLAHDSITNETGGQARRRPHICFVAPAAWPVLTANIEIPTVGGAEVQQCTIARALIESGYRVSMICMDYGQPDRTIVDGVTVFKSFKPANGIPVLRFLYPRLTSLWNAMHRADADIYYQRSASMLTGIVAAFCRRHGRKSVYAGASDSDFMPGKELVRYWRDVKLFRYGLHNVDAVVAQNPTQQQDCRRHYARNPVLIPSCYVPPADSRGREESGNEILWVSTIRHYKRPEVFLDIARRLPEFRFKMIGGPGGGDTKSRHYFSEIEAAARDISNLEFLGFVPYSQVDAHFDRARIFVNTSFYEGFPNTFLQSWARGIPTVSFFDPGSRDDGEPVACLVHDESHAAREISGLMMDIDIWRKHSARCRSYFEVWHSVRTTVGMYEALFRTLTEHAEFPH